VTTLDEHELGDAMGRILALPDDEQDIIEELARKYVAAIHSIEMPDGARPSHVVIALGAACAAEEAGLVDVLRSVGVFDPMCMRREQARELLDASKEIARAAIDESDEEQLAPALRVVEGGRRG
jgi:hypothetical protein